MSDYKVFLRNAKNLFLLAGKAEGIREMEQTDAMAHVQLKLAHDAARADEIKRNPPPPKKWWSPL
jgi:hypothetical protein